jgi:hypothetical protein
MQPMRLLKMHSRRLIFFSFWWGRWGQHCVGDVFILFLCSYVFPYVPQVLHVFSIASHFFSMWFCQRRAIHIETSILGSFQSFNFFSFFELMGQSKWFSAIKIILNAQIMCKNRVCEYLPLHIELLVYS